jgi:RNA polymerase sigma-70 factor (ECF subfamily)
VIPSFEDLLERSRRLEPSALMQVYDYFYPEVYRYIRFRLHEDNIVEDLAAEVFLQFLEALNRRRGPDRNLRGWLLGTASNLVHDHLRRKYRRKELLLEDELDQTQVETQTPEHSWEVLSLKKDVRMALQKLTPEQQHVLALRFADDRSLEETAQALGKKANAVKALQFRALASLRRHLSEE